MTETNEPSVQLVQVAYSPYCQTVRMALAHKGVPFSVVEEDLQNKSKLLLENNPIHRKVPVLLINGRPIAESSIIVQYINDAWPHGQSLFPDTAYERAQARFWVDFIHVKIIRTAFQMVQYKDDEINREAFEESMMTLNAALGVEKPYFFGKRLGYVDITIAPFISWFPSLDKFVNLRIPSRTAAPRLHEWIEAVSEHPNVKPELFAAAFVEKKLGGVRAVYRSMAEARKAHA